MKKFISVFTALTTTLWLVGGLFTIIPVHGATLVDGDIVREADEFDVYIIKLVGTDKFKRLILNPDVFNMYGHLKWSNVKVVANGDLAAYTTSELVREINDEKVYKLYPDGDTGTKKWVETLACFTSQGYNWNSVYIINSFDRDSYTTAATTLCGGAAEVGALTLSLASDTPAAMTLSYNAYGVTFMKVKVEGSGTISQMTVKRSGAGSVDDFDNVYIYEGDKRLTSGRTISSATSKVTFIGLKIKAPTTISIVADLSGTAGNQDYFEILSASDVTADATVGGTFPLAGKFMAMSASPAGTLIVAVSGSITCNVTVGDVGAQISAFKVSTATEGTKISRIQLYNSGTVTSTKLTNLKLKVLGNTVATADTFTSDGYVVFSLATPYEIKKGGSAIFSVYSDIAGKSGEDIELYLELATDILGTGTTFGYGMQATITSFDDTSTDHVIATLIGGDLTLVKTGPNATNIGNDTDDTVFLEFTMSAATDITISKTVLYWCADLDGSGAYGAITSMSEIEDVKIVNTDTGVVWAGPHDGSLFTTVTTWTPCPDSQEGRYKNFTDTFDLAAGGTYHLKVTGDVKGADNLVANSAVKLGLYSYATLVGTGNVSFLKYTNTTTAVPNTSIVPSGDILGEEMTVQTAGLTITLANSPSGTNRTYVSGEKVVDVVGLTFTAGVASAIKVTDLDLTGYVDCSGTTGGTFGAGQETTSCKVKNTVSSVEIWDTTANALVPGSLAKGFSGTTAELVAYTGLNWTIPAGESRTLLVKANLSSIIPTASYNMISFDIATPATQVTCQDKDSNSITVSTTYNAKNNGTSPTVAVAVYPFGTIAIDNATDTPLQSILTMGSTNNEVSKIKLTGAREALYLDKFSTALDTDGATSDGDNFTGVALKYQTESQWGTSDWTISSKKTFTYAVGSISFDFSGSARPYVPKDDDSYITVLVDVQGYVAGTGADSGDYTYFTTDSDDSTEFKAYGAKSGHLTTSATDPTATDFAYHYIFRSRPVFAKKAWSGDINELARFTITAQGYNVTFDGQDTADLGFHTTPDTVVSAGLEFDVIASGTDETTQTLSLYDWNNVIVSSVSAVTLSHADKVSTSVDYTEGGQCSLAAGECLTTISFHFEAASSAVIIAKDVTREFYVMIDNGMDFNNQDEFIQLKLLNDKGAAGGATAYTNCNIVWYDGTNDEGGTEFDSRICMPASMHGIGDFPFSFRLLQGTVTE